MAGAQDVGVNTGSNVSVEFVEIKSAEYEKYITDCKHGIRNNYV